MLLSTQPVKRMMPWAGVLCLLLLACSLSACGGGDATASTTSSSPAQTNTYSSGSSSASANAATITITEKTGGHDIYSFDPQTITIKAGTAVKWINNSDENHKLAITPAGPTAGTVTKSGSNDNTLTVTFPTAGTYTVTSQLVDRLKDGNHTPDPADSKATLTVTVS